MSRISGLLGGISIGAYEYLVAKSIIKSRCLLNFLA